MKILDDTIHRLKKSKPLYGLTLGFCLQLTKETAVLLIGAKELGARVVASAGNPLTTQDDVAAFLVSRGITVFGWSNQTQKEFAWCVYNVLKQRPDIVTDDGAELSIMIHKNPEFSDLDIIGATEETTTGINRIKALQNSCKLRYPVISVNDAATKHLFDNRYGTGQSTIDGYLRAMNLLFAAKQVVVAGYGWVGKGVASRCKAMGARVIVTEVDPIRALEAHMDGYGVMQMDRAVQIGDIFITCTAMVNVISKRHFESMKDGAVVGNVGHFDVEVDAKFLLHRSQYVKNMRPGLDKCIINNKTIFLVSKGRVANLAVTEGHPPEVMDQSFSNQLLSILHLFKNYKKLPNQILEVPACIDTAIAKKALKSSNVKIDKLTIEQIKWCGPR